MLIANLLTCSSDTACQAYNYYLVELFQKNLASFFSSALWKAFLLSICLHALSIFAFLLVNTWGYCIFGGGENIHCTNTVEFTCTLRKLISSYTEPWPEILNFSAIFNLFCLTNHSKDRWHFCLLINLWTFVFLIIFFIITGQVDISLAEVVTWVLAAWNLD